MKIMHYLRSCGFVVIIVSSLILTLTQCQQKERRLNTAQLAWIEHLIPHPILPEPERSLPGMA